MLQCIAAQLFGPLAYVNAARPTALESIPIGNRVAQKFIRGTAKRGLPWSLRYPFFVDIRDVALSHVLAAEKEEAAGKRLFIVADNFCYKQIAEIIGDMFPELSDKLPTKE